MIDIKNIKFGESVYHIYETHNFFRKKIQMTDSEGVTWYRYPDPIKTFEIHEMIYCGRVESLVFGEVEDEIENIEYYFKGITSGNSRNYNIYSKAELDSESHLWFNSREEAEQTKIMMVLENEE